MEKTNLNVNPYYDDFNEEKQFQRVLFRPGFAVQARELTQLQTILQSQIDRLGRHMFKEGSVVIPGASGFDNEFYAVKLQSNYNASDISGYIDDYVGTVITGSETGIQAKVISAVAATTADPITLYVKYIDAGTEKDVEQFQNGELISADAAVGAFGVDVESAVLLTSDATAIGSTANIQEGVYFVRGHFVRVAEQRILLDKYGSTPTYRIGLDISETLETPEEDTSLLDNAQGTSNENAKGAHRLKITLTLSKKTLDDVNDDNFVELMRVKDGVLETHARNTEYSILEQTLARRTYEESGDYTLEDFDYDIRETLDNGFNDGVYTSSQTTDSGNTPSDNLLTLQVSPGEAYVRGYEVDIISPRYVDIAKPREVATVEETNTAIEVGNFVVATNLNTIPDFSPQLTTDDSSVAFDKIELYDTKTSSRGSASGNIIGYARGRSIEFVSGSSSSGVFATNSEYKVYLFDIRMFNKITLSGTPSPAIVGGERIDEIDVNTGLPTGNYGFAASDSSGTTLYLTSVVGTISSANKFKTSATNSNIVNSGSTELTVSSVETFAFENVKQLFMAENYGTATPNFTADVKLETEVTLSGTYRTETTGTDNLIGISGYDTSEVKVGDILDIPVGDGTTEERVVDAVTSTAISFTAAPSTDNVTSANIIRKRAKLTDQDKNILLRKLQKETIKTLKTESNSFVSDTDVYVKEQFISTSNSSGEVAIGADTNGTFLAKTNSNYVVTVLTAGTAGSAAAGDMIDVEDLTITGVNTANATLTSSAIFGDGAVVKITATILKTNTNEVTKTRSRAQLVHVINDSNGAVYGTSSIHKDISLGKSDGYRVWAIYDSGTAGTAATLPEFDVGSSIVGTPVRGEVITGGTSGARGILINETNPFAYALIGTTDFSVGETVTGFESGATATVGTITTGSTLVTTSYDFDNGQRDNYYDIARIVRKPSATPPSGDLLVVWDYFGHSTGAFCSVDSYSDIGYADIQTYTATKVDPEQREPSGEFDLRDCIDFRAKVADVSVGSPQSITLSTGSVSAEVVTGYSFNFEGRTYGGTGGNDILIPVDNQNVTYNLEHYLPRIDSVYLTPEGDFRVISGTPAESPEAPAELDNAMKLVTLDMPAFVINIDDIRVTPEIHRRYTMRDIGKLESRIENIEYYTSLSLLEKDTESFQIQDANGLDRFKSGFVVDNFAGHGTGDVRHPDYKVSMDLQAGELRPKYNMKNVKLKEVNDVDEADVDLARAGDNYVVSEADIATLPYEHVVVAEQPYATRVENLNPVLNFAWAGNMILKPSVDRWFEVKRLPALVINREGNFDSVLAANKNAIGTVWNAWQTQWTGTTSTKTDQYRERSFSRSRQLGVRRGRAVVQRTVTTQRGKSSRQGVRTTVVPKIDRKSLGTRTLSRAVVPFIRKKNVYFEATGMRPFTRVYPFFDNKDVSPYVTPVSGSVVGNANAYKKVKIPASPLWTQVDKLEIKYYKVGGNPLLITVDWSHTPDDPDSWTNIVTSQQHPGKRNNTIILSGLNLSAGNKGEIYFRIFATDTNDVIGANDRLYWIKAYDQNNTLIPWRGSAGANYKLKSSKRWTRPGWGLAHGKGYAVFEHKKYRRKDKQNEITIGVRNGTRTVTPSSGTELILDYSDPNNPGIEGNDYALVTNAAGNVAGYFSIPNPKVSGNPKFKTGKRLFRLTSSATNSDVADTFAQTIYRASGVLNTVQEKIIATRNAVVKTQVVSQTKNVKKTSTRERVVGWWDPLAQSFMPQADGGEYITKVDAFFSQKDKTLPVTCEIREMDNGYPTTTVLPHASRTLEPNQVNTSSTASVATTFEFEAPVYVKDGTEYCIVLHTNSDKYLAWISRMGEIDVGGKRLVSEQPYLGVLFKSQNNTTWTAFDMEDLKFKLYRAKFDTNVTGLIELRNEVLDEEDVEVLDPNPLQSFDPITILSGTGDGSTTAFTMTKSNPSTSLMEVTLDGTITTAFSVSGTTLTFDSAPSSAAVIVAKLGSASIKVFHDDHGMYEASRNNVTITGVSSGISTSISADVSTTATSISISDTTSFDNPAGKYRFVNGVTGYAKIIQLDENGEEHDPTEYPHEVITYTGVSSGQLTGVTRNINAVGAQEFYTANSSDADATGYSAKVELYHINNIPLTDINKTHTSITYPQMDYYVITTTTGANIGSRFGGNNVRATENVMMDQVQVQIPTVEHPDTTLTASIRTTTARSPSGSQTSFTRSSFANREFITLNENHYFVNPKLIASEINETNEMSGADSFLCYLEMTSTRDNLSPVVDIEDMSVVAVSNRINNIDDVPAGQDEDFYVFPNSTTPDGASSIFVKPTEPEGDNNEVIYITRKAQLENPATSIKVLLDANRQPDADIEVLYKILRSDDASDFEEIGWTYFNENGSPDTTVNASTTPEDFLEYQFTADDLDEFIAFSVKIRMKSTNSAQPPRIKDLRAIALAT